MFAQLYTSINALAPRRIPFDRTVLHKSCIAADSLVDHDQS